MSRVTTIRTESSFCVALSKSSATVVLKTRMNLVHVLCAYGQSFHRETAYWQLRMFYKNSIKLLWLLMTPMYAWPAQLDVVFNDSKPQSVI